MNTVIDELYGEYHVNCIIFEIMETSVFKRLRNIHQSGGGYLINELWNVTRYEHSVGTMILSLKFGGNVEEQIKSLLHDISHSAFSHVIDYILKNNNEDYHEIIQKDFLKNEELINIFEKYRLNLDRIMSTNYNLLDADLPDLSFDRIDYTLRDLFRQKLIAKDDINFLLNYIIVHKNILCFNSIEAGKYFKELYFKETEGHFNDPLNKYINTMLSKLLSKALQEKIIELKDFNFTEEIILEKIKNSRYKEELKNIVNKKYFDFFLQSNRKVEVKQRYIDPYVFINGVIRRLSGF
ncbi:MAG: HD domain-containing protein [Pseudoleptotrichia goodfellowii]|nr:HD domain-containing protein [Pseudoleptotrichia goodfellowii]